MDKTMDNQIKNILEIVAQQYDIKKWRYEKKSFGKDVLNYMSKIAPFTLIDEDAGTNMDLVVKIALQESYLENVIDALYNREVYFYKNLVPIFEKAKVNLKDLFPVCHYAVSNKDSRVIVLNDMTTQGFRRYNFGMYLDHEHMLVTLQAIAKFHGLSMISSQKIMKLPGIKVLKPFLDDDPVFYMKIQKFLFRKYSLFFKDMKCANYLNKFCNYVNNAADFLKQSLTKARCLVYAHGDLWKENILFKYSDTKPVQVCLVDYQITRLMSPAAELLYSIMNCTESSVRREHFTSFVSAYYHSLQHTLRSNGLEPKILYSEEDLKHDLRLVFPACFSLSFMSFLLWLDVESSESMFNESPALPNVKSKHFITFKNIVERLVIDFQDLGIISPLEDF